MADRTSAVESGVRRTSNLFIEGERYAGEFDPDSLLRAIRRRAAVDRTVAAQSGEFPSVET
jgi:hypothetical protein